MEPPPLSSDLLMDLYRIAVEEYRFEVKLNWDRTVYYLTLNSGIISIATGLLKVGGPPPVDFLVAGVETTIGQREHLQILHDTDAWVRRPLRSSSITFLIVAILYIFCAANIGGMVGSIWLYLHPATPPDTELVSRPMLVPRQF